MFHEPVRYDAIKEGGLRRLTLGEINLASSLFGFSIHYHQVWIHLESYLPFNLQSAKTAMTPNGEMWFREETYEDDFSMPLKHKIEEQHLFMHEMMHVWQHQRGMWVRTRGAFSWAADYSYSLDQSNLLDYSLEQQTSLVSDYRLVRTYGSYNNTYLIQLRDYDCSKTDSEFLTKYEEILGDILL